MRKLIIALVTAAFTGSFVCAASAETWKDLVPQTPRALGLTADGSYAYTHLRWGRLDTSGSDSRTGHGDIYQRICWEACHKWRVTGHVTLTFAGAEYGEWSVAKIVSVFAPRWLHLNRSQRGVYAAGTHYADIFGSGNSVPQFSPKLISRHTYLRRIRDAQHAYNR